MHSRTRLALCCVPLGLFAPSAVTATATDHESFRYGADLRLRQIFIGNVGFDHASPTADRTFQRFRVRAWGDYLPTEGIGASARLVWEGRHYSKPAPDTYPIPGYEPWYSGGLLFDRLTLNLAVKSVAGSSLGIQIGRQDLMFGDGWLIFEGTPFDGSRTFYFDAARATWTSGSGATLVDLIYIDQNADTGRFPQPFDGGSEDQVEQDETGAILYARNKSLLKDGDLDGYFIYKHSRPNLTPGNLRIENGTPFRSPPDSGDLYLLGARAETKLGPRWKLRAEGAYEWGTRNDADLSAFGFNGRLGYLLNDRYDQELHLGYEYLSGDDPGDASDQAFDPLWGRWAQWSELLIYDATLDSRISECTNFQRINLGWGAQVHPTARVTLDYHAVWANENSARTPAQFANLSEDGKFRGHLFAGWLRIKLDRHLSGHLVAEYFQPGNYYAKDRRDNGFFVRAELSLAW